jgi:PST family polysaccharide transporter
MSAGCSLLIQIASTVVLARILTPSDFGVVTMVTTFSLLFSNFGYNGFTEAILQRSELDEALCSNLFWISVGCGTLLTVAFAAGGTLLAHFYRDPRVTHVAMGASLSIVLTSLSVVHLALLKRSMRFTALAANDITARFLSVGLSVALAAAGWGYWALVAGIVALPLSTSMGGWLLCRWAPRLPRKGEGTGSMVKFAMHTYGRFSFNYFSRNTDNLLVGWYFNATTLGFYKKAYDLFALSANQLTVPMTDVCVSTLSRLNRDWPRYRKYVVTAVEVIAFIGMGLGGGLTLTGRDVIRVLLGPKWGETGRIFTYFGPGVGLMLLYATHGWIHLSIGRADRWLRWGIVEFIVTVTMFFIGLHWGPVGVASAWTLSFAILLVPAYWYAWKPTNVGFGPVLAVIWRFPLAALLVGAATAAAVPHVRLLAALPGAGGAFVRIILVLAIFESLYVTAVILLHGSLDPLRQVMRLIRETLPTRSAAPSKSTEPVALVEKV